VVKGPKNKQGTISLEKRKGKKKKSATKKGTYAPELYSCFIL
jgi:hypothetical protein